MSAPEQEDDLLAGEYALGLLEAEDLLAARALEAQNDEFARKVAWWQAQLAPLADRIEGAEPPQAVWRAIEAEIARLSANQGDGENTIVELERMRKRLRRWKLVAAVSSAAAAVALAFQFIPRADQPGQRADQPQMVRASGEPLFGTVPIQGTDLRLDLAYLPERESLIVAAIGLTSDGVHDHELWLVPEEGELISLGVVKPGEVRAHKLPHEVAVKLADGSKLVLTREPIGGKPPDRSAGPVVADGALKKV